jgi:hypothetical protein
MSQRWLSGRNRLPFGVLSPVGVHQASPLLFTGRAVYDANATSLASSALPHDAVRAAVCMCRRKRRGVADREDHVDLRGNGMVREARPGSVQAGNFDPWACVAATVAVVKKYRV